MIGTKKTHLRVAEIAAAILETKTKRVHEMLGEIYIALSRELTNEQRNNCLVLLNETMRELREVTESTDYVKLSVVGIASDIDLGLESLRRHLLGNSNQGDKTTGGVDWTSMPRDPEEKGY